MRIYINRYRDHWISPYTILEKFFFWREIDYDEPIIEKWSNRLNPFCEFLRKVLNTINPKINYVKIDSWDTWSMDNTLAQIVLPMLKQLRDTKNGSPMVDLEDVPEHLRTTNTFEYDEQMVFDFYKEDELFGDQYPDIHARWDWVLNEMIWAFEQKVNDDAEGQFFDHSEYEKDFGKEWLIDISKGNSKIKIDWDGLIAWQKRKENGFRLFGVYFEGLWD
jgi:hypothetical protein